MDLPPFLPVLRPPTLACLSYAWTRVPPKDEQLVHEMGRKMVWTKVGFLHRVYGAVLDPSFSLPIPLLTE